MKLLRLAGRCVSILTLFVAAITGCAASQQPSAVQQENKSRPGTRGDTQQPTIRVGIDGPITVANQPDPDQEKRYAEQRAQAQFDNLIDGGTLLFVGVAAAAAIGAWVANRRLRPRC